MFDILKKKITGFIDKLTKKESEKETKDVAEKKVNPEPQIKEEKLQEKKTEVTEKSIPEIKKEKPELKASEEKLELPVKPKPQEIKIKEKGTTKPEKSEKQRQVDFGIISQVKSIVTGQIEINKQDIKGLVSDFEIELIEADVALEVSESLIKDLENRLVGQKIRRGEVNNFIKETIKEMLIQLISNKAAFDINEKAKVSEKPLKIMFLGINGAGKTTTIAKIANLLIKNNFKVILASADTFRAAAIEQMQIHADRLKIKNIKRDYGSDPTAVAYDAVNHARANSIDVVLIDTAGRQDTNTNLLNELKKMDRVIKPDLKLYIGESIAGNAIISQVLEFNKQIGIDGIILTKLDCDAKGGTVLSISKMTNLPIVYIGTGQGYEDLEKFDPDKIISAIIN
ncbi:signal recognition particle-docking protein FtsY [Candidatus Micrarchaeota archaeon]|nr:signal recognition particle-docking protein FtsY [Candidatus Micrarchaeota archaeon]